jgi:hypothetical protein
MVTIVASQRFLNPERGAIRVLIGVELDNIVYRDVKRLGDRFNGDRGRVRVKFKDARTYKPLQSFGDRHKNLPVRIRSRYARIATAVYRPSAPHRSMT